MTDPKIVIPDAIQARQHPLVEHARRELEILGEEPAIIEEYLKVIQAFVNMENSGRVHGGVIPTIGRLLREGTLSPLTNYPDDWQLYTNFSIMGIITDVWQSKRNPCAFSYDGGNTYRIYRENSCSPVMKSIRDSRSKLC